MCARLVVHADCLFTNEFIIMIELCRWGKNTDINKSDFGDENRLQQYITNSYTHTAGKCITPQTFKPLFNQWLY